MVNIAVSVLGLVFALFLPGYFITLIFFKGLKALERLMLSIAFSVMLAVTIGIVLGYNESAFDLTGGITKTNVWMLELIITLILGLIALAVNWGNTDIRKVFMMWKKTKTSVKKMSKKKETVKFKKL